MAQTTTKVRTQSTVIHKKDGQRTYARCKGRPGHRWDDHPNYDRPMHDWAIGRMAFRCSECTRVKVYEVDSNGDWYVYYYETPADYKAVTADVGEGNRSMSDIKNYWAAEYYAQAFERKAIGNGSR